MKTVTGDRSVATGVKLILPIAAADTLDGIAFGVIAAGIGLAPLPSIVMSATSFSGSALFAALTVLSDRGGLAAILVAVVALNSRYLVYAGSVLPALSRSAVRRAAESQLLTDASWALSLRDGAPRRGILLGAGAASLVAWTGGTAIGVLCGTAVGGYRSLGIDAALPAFFLCLLVDRLRLGGAGAAVLGALVAVALAPFLPPGVPLLVVLVAMLVLRR
jgi:predicted branched-subunit amino acid permease